METKSCQNCGKREVCEFKPRASLVFRPRGLPFSMPCPDFVDKLFELYGKYCIHYKEDQEL